jgi:hypothetical protein
MTRLSIAALLILSLTGCSGRTAEESLGGTWMSDVSKSDPLISRSAAPLGAKVTLIIGTTPSTVSVRRIASSARGEHVRELTYSTNGQEQTNRNFRGTEVVSRSWWDGRALIAKGRQHIDSPVGRVAADLNEVWSVTPDGRTLTIDSTVSVAGLRSMTHKEVYVKKDQ